MNAQLSSVVALIYVVVGGIAVCLMLELKGRARDRNINSILIFLHRFLGYLFTAIYVVMLYFMIMKISSYQEELSPRVVLHVALGIGLAPLIFVKILIARRHKLLTSHLLGLGVTILLFSFVLTGLTAGHYFLHKSDLRYIALSELDTSVLDVSLGRLILKKKCGKCHTLERVFRSFKSEKGWEKTINRMATLDAPNIRDFDIKQIMHFLVEQQKTRKGSAALVEKEIGETLINRKCSVCHSLERVYSAEMDEKQWSDTIDEMVEISGNPNHLSQREKLEIIRFLSTN